MLSQHEKLQNDYESSDTPAGIAQGDTFGDAGDIRGIQGHIDTLLRAHRDTSGTHLRLYKLRDLPNDVLPGLNTSTSLRSNPTKLENFNNATDAINAADLLPIFGRTTKPTEFHRLEIDDSEYILLVNGNNFVGSHKRWASIYDIRYDYKPADDAPEDGWPRGSKNEPVTVREVVDVRELRNCFPYCRKGAHVDEERLIADITNTAIHIPGSPKLGSTVVPYPNIFAYGRKYARAPSLQRPSRVGRGAASRSNAVGVDMENCHATLLLRILRQSYAVDSKDEGARGENSPALVNNVEYYRDWGKFFQEYYDVSIGEAGKVPNTLFYGGFCPRGDVPLLHLRMMEIMRAALFLAGHRRYKHLSGYYKDREMPLYGHLASILSFEE